MNKYRICIVEPLEQDGEVVAAAQKLKKEKQIAFVFSSCGTEFLSDKYTCFIVQDFEGPVFDNLHRHEAKIMGPTALKMAANGDERINIAQMRRPLYSLALYGANVCFTRYRTMWEHMNRISRLVYHMGGRVRREMKNETTHLIAHSPGGEKYDYADTFKIPIMADTWVLSAWEKNNDAEFSAIQDDVVNQHKLRLGGVRICFLGFSPEDTQTYKDYLVKNNGAVCEINDPLCNHIVVNDKEDETTAPLESVPASCCVVKSEWWWTTMENESYVDVKGYLMVDDVNQTPDGRQASTPGSAASRAKKRKRLQQLAGFSGSPARGKRRSSANTLDFSGNYLDWTLTPDKDARDGAQKEAKPVSARQLKFYELVSTETNYVDILEVIVKSFKLPLEESRKNMGDAEMQENDEAVNPILDSMEIKMIFGNLPPILDVHKSMLEELKAGGNKWTPDFAIGEVILKRAAELQKAYPPFINNFEKSVETLNTCEKLSPRFHAFLKIRQNKPECGRQSLKELLIRPVQRLPSISLLLGDLLKHTDEKHPDHIHLKSALATIKEVMTHINEDKRRTEAQVAILELFNQIDNCPPELISSQRTLVLKCECLETTDGRKGDPVTLLLFTDILEICCKRRAKNFTLRGTKSLQKCLKSKPYKHLRHIRLSHIKRVVSLNDSEECQNAFALEMLNNDRLQDPDSTLGAINEDIILVNTFSLIDDVLTKPKFLQQLCKQTAAAHCIRDPSELLNSMDKADLIMDEAPKHSSHSLTKAFRFASSAKTKMGRALSLSRTPSRASRIMPRRQDSTASADHSPGLIRRLESCANLNDSIVSLY